MNKEQFLQGLEQNLSNLPKDVVTDILRDQSEYIQDAITAGRSEQSVVDSLGDPKTFAANLKAEAKLSLASESASLPKKMQSTFGAFFAVLALAPLNLIFAMGPFLIFVFIIALGWTLAGSFLVASFSTFGLFLFKLIFMNVGMWIHISTFFLALGLVGASLLTLLLVYKLTEVIVKMTISYLKWNVEFAKGRS